MPVGDNLVPRPSPAPVFGCLQYGERRPGRSRLTVTSGGQRVDTRGEGQGGEGQGGEGRGGEGRGGGGTRGGRDEGGEGRGGEGQGGQCLTIIIDYS